MAIDSKFMNCMFILAVKRRIGKFWGKNHILLLVEELELVTDIESNILGTDIPPMDMVDVNTVIQQLSFRKSEVGLGFQIQHEGNLKRNIIRVLRKFIQMGRS